MALIGYALLAHTAILRGETGMASLLLIAVPLLLVARTWNARLLIGLAGGAALLLVDTIEQGPPLYYLPPILINLLLAGLFGSTLRRGRTPLVTQYSILHRGRLEPGVVGYTRRVTQVWTAFFLLLAGESLLLSIFATVETWSLFANVLNYVFVAALLVGEYLWRLRRLSGLEHPGLMRFLLSLMSTHVSKIHRP